MSLKEKFQNLWHVPEDEYEEDAEQQETDESSAFQTEEPSRRLSFFGTESVSRPEEYTSQSNTGSFGRAFRSGGANVVNISEKTKAKVALFKPLTFGEETRVIADELIKKHTVIVNLEKTEPDIRRRIIDFLSGVAYSYGGNIKRIASGTFIIIPYNVDLMGDSVTDDIENGSYF